MRHFTHILNLKKFLQEKKASGKTVGLVPTMGALHGGHESLVRASVAENDITVTCIFVNPTQFNNDDDYRNYPKTRDSDFKILTALNNSVVFTPSENEIYKDSPLIKLNFGSLQEQMEGKFRAGHFNGVGIIITKLFNIVKPDVAYFGQKDLQQFAVVKQLVKDFSFDVELRCMPILRDDNGLALSSRNKRLSARHLKEATILYSALKVAQYSIRDGKSLDLVVDEVHNMFVDSIVDLEYFEIVDSTSLEKIDHYNPETTIALCIAGYVGEVRLIDNMIIGK